MNYLSAQSTVMVAPTIMLGLVLLASILILPRPESPPVVFRHERPAAKPSAATPAATSTLHHQGPDHRANNQQAKTIPDEVHVLQSLGNW
jgi:uncharacterized lipoprotein YajG